MNAIFFNTDDACIPRAWLLLHSIRNHGQFQGDIVCVSTSLSNSSIRYLEQNGVICFVRPFESIDFNRIASNLGEELLRYSPFLGHASRKLDELRGELSESNLTSWLFRLYEEYWSSIKLLATRSLFDRMFSKILVADFLEQNGSKYEKVLVLDSDVIVQGPLESVFREMIEGKIALSFQLEEAYPGHHAYYKNAAFSKQRGQAVRRLKNEPTGGVLGGFAGDVQGMYRDIWNVITDETYLKCFNHCLWDEDIIREHFLRNNDRFSAFPERCVVNLSNHFHKAFESEPFEWFRVKPKESQEYPTLVHFNAGSYGAFDRIREVYESSAAQVLFSELEDFSLREAISFGTNNSAIESFTNNTTDGIDAIYLGCFLGSRSYQLSKLNLRFLVLVDGFVWQRSWPDVLKERHQYNWFYQSLSHLDQSEVIRYMHENQDSFSLYEKLEDAVDSGVRYKLVISGRATRPELFEADLRCVVDWLAADALWVIERFVNFKTDYQKSLLEKLRFALPGLSTLTIDPETGDLLVFIGSTNI